MTIPFPRTDNSPVPGAIGPKAQTGPGGICWVRKTGEVEVPKKRASPTDLFLGQLSGLVFGLLAAVAVFLVPAWASRSWELIPLACVAVVLLPALGILLGTYWGSRPQQDGDRRRGRP
jgi:hypothetical protein